MAQQMRINRETGGVFIITPTPFADDGSLDLDSADRMVDFYLECGVDGMTILGIMGEAPKLSGEESLALARRVLGRVDGRIPVVVGVSGAGLDNMARFAHASMEMGAAGVMAVPMPGLSTEARQKAYFEQLCGALGPDVPFCLQDYPQSTGVHLDVETILALTRKHPQFVMLKHEDWPGLNKLTRIRAESERSKAPRLSIMVGNFALFLPQELERGADGAMTGFAYPEMLVEVVARHRAGDADGAEDLFDAYLPLMRYEQQPGVGLAMRKEILKRRGVLASAKARDPGPALTGDDVAEITRLVARLERRLAEGPA